MAEKDTPKVRTLRKVETVRQRADKSTPKPKTRRLRAAKARISKPFKVVATIGKKEYYLPMPANKFGNFLNKRRSLMPSYFIDSFKELRQVVWPNRKTTVQLSAAVFMFAIFFSLIVTLTDYGLEKVFKQLIIK